MMDGSGPNNKDPWGQRGPNPITDDNEWFSILQEDEWMDKPTSIILIIDLLNTK